MTDVTTVLHRVGVNRDEELKGASKGCHRPTPLSWQPNSGKVRP